MDSYILAGFTAEGQYVEVKYGDDADLEAIQSWLEDSETGGERVPS